MSSPLRVAAVIRMSTDAQANSPERQRTLFRTYCEKWQATPAGEYEDLGVSATHTSLEDRPGLMRLLADAGFDRFDVVWAEEQSRLTRDPLEVLHIQRALARHGIPIVDNSEDPRAAKLTAERELLAAVRAALSRYEVRQLGDRIRRDQAVRVAAGKYVGGCLPTGLLWDREQQRYQLEPIGAEIVRRVFHLYTETRSATETASRLNTLGLLTRRGYLWTADRVLALLRNSAYRGQRYYRGDTYPTDLPEVVPADLVAQVDVILGQMTGRPRRATHNTNRAVFSGLLRCPECGNWLNVTNAGTLATGERVLAYRCHRAHNPTRRCHWRRVIRENRLEPVIVAALAAALKHVRPSAPPRPKRALVATPDAALEDLEAQRKRAVALCVRGMIDDDELGEELERIAAQRRLLLAEQEEMSPETPAVTREQAQEFLRTLGKHWRKLEPPEKRALLHAVISHIVPDADNLPASRLVWRA